MITRQKILLLMLRHAERPVQRLELMKWCFLLRHESETGGGSSFYDFVPYKYGPFSFALYQEIEKLESMSFIVSNGESWKLAGEVDAARGVSDAVELEVKRVVKAFSQMSNSDLLDYVYHRHPAFTVNSDRLRLELRPTADVAVYTAGYEGVSIDGFLNLLIKSGIERLIDVRSNPIARRYGFHKSTLSRLVNHLNIDYRHFGELGIQSEIRQLFPADGDRKVMFCEYESNTLANEQAAISEVSRLVNERPSVLVLAWRRSRGLPPKSACKARGGADRSADRPLGTPG